MQQTEGVPGPTTGCPDILTGEDLTSFLPLPSPYLTFYEMLGAGDPFQRILIAPKPVLKDASALTQSQKLFICTPPPLCPPPQRLGKGVSGVTPSLPLRCLSHCLGIRELAGSESGVWRGAWNR